MASKTSSKDNLSHGERQALLDLRNNKSIVIKPADKGGAIVILNRTDYITEGERHLNDNITYKKLSCDPHDKHVKIINKEIDHRQVDQEIKDALRPKETLRLRLCTSCPKFTNQEARPQCVP